MNETNELLESIEERLSVEAIDLINAYKEDASKMKHTNMVMQLQLRKAGDMILQMEERMQAMNEELETLRTIQMRAQAEAEANEQAPEYFNDDTVEHTVESASE